MSMPPTNAAILAEFASGIGTQGAIFYIDNENGRVGIGTTIPNAELQVVGVVSATAYYGNGQYLTGIDATSLKDSGGTVRIQANMSGAALTGNLVISGNLQVDGTQTVINTEVLDVEDRTIGIASTSTASNSTADGAGIVVYGGGDGDKTFLYDDSKKGWSSSVPISADQVRFLNVSEKITRIDGNTATLNYDSGNSNVGLCTNPTGPITLDVINIPTSPDFDDQSISFSVFITQSGIARSCTSVYLNGVSKQIRWAGGSLGNATLGVTTTNGYDIYNFVGVNTVGSASTTDNYIILGSVNGGYI